MSKIEVKTESAFEEDGVFDDKCATCARRCCCAPPPFRVAIVPVLIIILVSIAVYLVFWNDYTGLCKSMEANSSLACVARNETDTVTNTTRLTVCPPRDHDCYYLVIANVPVAIWGLFMLVIVAGFAIIRAIVSIVWWIFRAISGKHGVVWAFIKPLDNSVAWLVWNFLFFIAYNTFLFTATPLVYVVCSAVSVVILIACVVVIVAHILSTMIGRYLSRKSRERVSKVRAKARLIDKALGEGKAQSIAARLSFGLSKTFEKTLKNAKKTAKASAGGDDVVVEMTSRSDLTDDELAEIFGKIDTNKSGSISSKELAKHAGLSGIFAKDLWSIFSEDPDAQIYLPEFIRGVRDMERQTRDAINELENRELVSRFVHLLILVLAAIIGVIIATESIQLHLATLLTAMSVLTLATTMAFTGVFARVLNAFIYVVVSRPFYRNDMVIIGADTVLVKKVTLLNTYTMTLDGKWAMFDNAAIAGGKLVNLSRSTDCVFIYEAAVHPDTPKKEIDTLERTVRAYIESKPQVWRDFAFTVTQLSGDNKLSIELRAFLRGARWSQLDVLNPARAELWWFIHRAIAQIGLLAAPKVPESVLVPVVAEETKKDDKGKEKEEKGEAKKEKVKHSTSKKEKDESKKDK